MVSNARKVRLGVEIGAKNLTNPAFKKVRQNVTKMRRSISRAFQGVSKNFLGMQNQLAATVAAVGGFQALVKGPAEFGKEIAKVGTLGSEARGRLDEFTESVRNLSVESGIAPESLAEGLFNVISAGTKADKAMQNLEISTKLAIAGSSDLATTVAGLSRVANAFGLETREEMEGLAKALFASQVQGLTTLESIASNVGKVGFAFRAAGLDIDQMLVGLSLITKTADSTETAATQLAGSLRAFQKPSENLLKTLDAMNITFSEDLLEGRNFVDFLVEVRKAGSNLGFTLRDLIPDQQGFMGVLALVNEEGQSFNDMLEEQKTLTGELDSSYTLMSETLDHTLSRFTSLLKILAQDFSSTAFGDLNKTLTAAVSNVSNLRIEAKIMGLDIKEAFLVVQPVIAVVIESVAFMVNSFRLAFQAIRSIIIQGANAFEGFLDTLKSVPFVQDLFTSRIDEFNKNMKDTISRRKTLSDELADVNIDLAAAMHSADLVERARRTGSGANEVAAARGFDPNDIGNLQAQKAQLEGRLSTIRVEMDRLISTGEQLTQEGFNPIGGIGLGADGFLGLSGTNDAEYDLVAREAIRNLENAINRQDSDTIFAELIGNIKGNLKKISSSVIDGADDGELKALQSHREKLQQELQNLGEGPAKTAIQDIVNEIEKVGEALKGATDATDELQKSFISQGITVGLSKIKSLEDQIKDLGTTIVTAGSSALARFFDDVANGSANASQAFSAFGRSILSTLNQILAQRAVLQLLTSLGFSSTPDTPTIPGKAMGGVNAGGFQAFARGGIVNAPTLGLVGEGAHNEAIVPLPDGRRIPVELRNSKSGDVFNIQISAVDGASVERMLGTDSGRRAIQSAMRDARSTRRDLR